MRLILPGPAKSRQIIEKAIVRTCRSCWEPELCEWQCEFLALTSSHPTKFVTWYSHCDLFLKLPCEQPMSYISAQLFQMLTQ